MAGELATFGCACQNDGADDAVALCYVGCLPVIEVNQYRFAEYSGNGITA
jgi:hypothetical protein